MAENNTSDPTTATLERFQREANNIRMYIDGKFEVLAERLDGMDKATQVLDESINRYPTDIDRAVKSLKAVMDERLKAQKESGLKREETLHKQIKDVYTLTDTKFVTLKTVVDANASQVALALDASEKAITKAESATDKRFEAINEFRKALAELSDRMATRRELEQSLVEIKGILNEHSKQLSEFRSRLDTGPAGLSTLQNQFASQQGVTQGSEITKADIRNAIGVAVAILGIIIALANGVFK